MAGLALTLAAGAEAALPSPVHAASADTGSELASLQEQVSRAASTYEDATGKAEQIDSEVTDLANKVLDIEQDRIPAYRERASKAARDLYKMERGSLNTLMSLLSSTSFTELMTAAKYVTAVKDDNIAKIDELRAAQDELAKKMAELGERKDEADDQARRAREALEQAKSAAAKMQEKAKAEDAAEVAAARAAAGRAAELQAEADAAGAAKRQAAQKEERPGLTASAGASQAGNGQGSADAGNRPQPGSNQGSGQGGQPQQPAPGDADLSQASGGWKTGVASYYGIGDGFMGGTTASGQTVTETSMGVAMLNVPLGTRVEIGYGGRSVVAVVNDRGPYAHGRVMDMQPAVARALNFLSVGVGTVRYRIL